MRPFMRPSQPCQLPATLCMRKAREHTRCCTSHARIHWPLFKKIKACGWPACLSPLLGLRAPAEEGSSIGL